MTTRGCRDGRTRPGSLPVRSNGSSAWASSFLSCFVARPRIASTPGRDVACLAANQLDACALHEVELAVQSSRPPVPEAVDGRRALVAVDEIRRTAGVDRLGRRRHCGEHEHSEQDPPLHEVLPTMIPKDRCVWRASSAALCRAAFAIHRTAGGSPACRRYRVTC